MAPPTMQCEKPNPDYHSTYRGKSGGTKILPDTCDVSMIRDNVCILSLASLASCVDNVHVDMYIQTRIDRYAHAQEAFRCAFISVKQN